MKLLKLLLVLLFLQPAFSNAQQIVQTPEKNQVDRSLVRDEDYSMTWYAMKDTAKVENRKSRYPDPEIR